jgi:acyl carrier protein phosphodiesterase
MHYLTHLYLSRNCSTNIIVGNFIGAASKRVCCSNSITKRNYDSINKEYIRGVILHDLVDQFINHHPIIIECKKGLIVNTKFKSESIDLFFDHFLASHWEKHSEYPIDQFIMNTYSQLVSQQKNYPYKCNRILSILIKNNLLFQYKTIDGLHLIIKKLGKVTGNTLVFESSLFYLANNYLSFQKKFEEFVPQLKAYMDIALELIEQLDLSGDIQASVDQFFKTENTESADAVAIEY